MTMLELPEIEVLKRDLEKEIVGRRVKTAEVRSNRNAMKIVKGHGRRKDFQEMLEGAKIDRIDRLGRVLLMELDTGNVFSVDLGDTGLLLKTGGTEQMETHTHVVLSFTIGGQLRIVDPKPTTELQVLTPDQVKALRDAPPFAVDPLAPGMQFTWSHFSGILEDRETPMRPLLIDGSFICGLGPLYADEILFTAGIRPDRPSNKLSSQDVRRLYRALMETFQEAIKARGTSIGELPFRDLHGESGTYQLELKVYEREGEFCRRCRHAIEKVQMNGTDAYFCRQCQS
jgi:formamidopyrimidine-DNA glycosylase